MNTKIFALVTGASSGLGNAITFELAQHNYAVFAGIRNEADKQQFVSNQNIIPLLLDVTKPQDIETAQRFISDETNNSGLALLINNAGVNYITAFELADENRERQLMEVNFFGAMSLTRKLLPLLHLHISTSNSAAKIINVSSIGGVFGLPWEAAYHASKFAMIGWSQSLRYELEELNISVCCFIPSGMKTKIFQKSIENSGSISANNQHKHFSYYKRNLEKMNLTMQKFEKGSATTQQAAKAISALLKKGKLPTKSFFGSDAKIIRVFNWLGLIGLLKGQFTTK